jgi:hypothetical protein
MRVHDVIISACVYVCARVCVEPKRAFLRACASAHVYTFDSLGVRVLVLHCNTNIET